LFSLVESSVPRKVSSNNTDQLKTFKFGESKGNPKKYDANGNNQKKITKARVLNIGGDHLQLRTVVSVKL
jgi:hypothetical protein